VNFQVHTSNSAKRGVFVGEGPGGGQLVRDVTDPPAAEPDRPLGGELQPRRFAHGAWHELPDGLILADSYHCSRYNTNTGRLTPA
ncbi:hypothetical protein R0J92_24910, partial [Tritonibacter sp. SIMBA_163]